MSEKLGILLIVLGVIAIFVSLFAKGPVKHG